MASRFLPEAMGGSRMFRRIRLCKRSTYQVGKAMHCSAHACGVPRACLRTPAQASQGFLFSPSPSLGKSVGDYFKQPTQARSAHPQQSRARPVGCAIHGALPDPGRPAPARGLSTAAKAVGEWSGLSHTCALGPRWRRRPSWAGELRRLPLGCGGGKW